MSVVITGIGMVCSLGVNRAQVWERLLTGSPKMGRITAFDARIYDLDDCVVAEVDNCALDQRIGDLRARSIDVAHKSRFRSMVLCAATECIEDASIELSQPNHRSEAGILLGTMTAGANETENIVLATHRGKKPRVTDNLGKRTVIAIQDIARNFDLGGQMFGVDAACASGAVAFAQAWRLVATGATPWCLAGGAEASIVASNIKSARTLRVIPTAFAQNPNAASRPFDQQRQGYVPAEGSCFLLLESEEFARARGARIYAKVAGIAERTFTGHPTRITSEFARNLMADALKLSRIAINELGWVNAHATSTVQGDAVEASAIDALSNGSDVPCSAPKSITGHLLGASGAFEAAFSALSLHEQRIPPTINLENLDPQCPVHCVRTQTSASFEHVLSNSFGFGGGSCSIILKRV